MNAARSAETAARAASDFADQAAQDAVRLMECPLDSVAETAESLSVRARAYAVHARRAALQAAEHQRLAEKLPRPERAYHAKWADEAASEANRWTRRAAEVTVEAEKLVERYGAQDD